MSGREECVDATSRETVYVSELPKRLLGNLLIDGPDGQCAYVYAGIEERCPRGAVAHTFTERGGEHVRVEMCSEHSREDVPERPTAEQQKLVPDGGEVSDGCGAAILRDNSQGAVFSDDREYRYRLWRTLDVGKPTLAWIMLNPSTADETEDDPTIRRCIDYAESWGYGRVVVGNLFAARSPDPDYLREHEAPVGPENDEHLREIVADADRVIAAWGNHGSYQGRGREVAQMFEGELVALDITQEGQPAHPLYQPGDVEPGPFSMGETHE